MRLLCFILRIIAELRDRATSRRRVQIEPTAPVFDEHDMWFAGMQEQAAAMLSQRTGVSYQAAWTTLKERYGVWRRSSSARYY